MAKQGAKPYKKGSGWSLRRRVFGQDLFESGHATAAAAKKAMDKVVLGLQELGKPKGLGPPARQPSGKPCRTWAWSACRS